MVTRGFLVVISHHLVALWRPDLSKPCPTISQMKSGGLWTVGSIVYITGNK